MAITTCTVIWATVLCSLVVLFAGLKKAHDDMWKEDHRRYYGRLSPFGRGSQLSGRTFKPIHAFATAAVVGLLVAGGFHTTTTVKSCDKDIVVACGPSNYLWGNG